MQHWVARARGLRLDRADLSDQRPGPARPPNRTPRRIERVIVALRRELRERSALGEFGAAAIRRELSARGHAPPPSLRTIGRVLERHGLLDGAKRPRRPPPPRGWYLPRLARAEAELDSFDVIEALVIKGGYRFEVLNAVSLHGGLMGSWPHTGQVDSDAVMHCLVLHWRKWGLPAYVQFDNDPIFSGGHGRPDIIGRVIRLCLSLDVVPVFAPPCEMGFQAAVENFNGQWESKVWRRFTHTNFLGLCSRSDAYIAEKIRRASPRLDSAPRRPFPKEWSKDAERPLRGMLICIRRTDARGRAAVLGRTFTVDHAWTHRLVRAEIDLDLHRVRFFRLRRKDPAQQDLLAEHAYNPQIKVAAARPTNADT